MFSFFKRRKNGKRSSKRSGPILVDLDNNPLNEGDRVLSLRYDLGECLLVGSDKGIQYESVTSGERVSWLKMIDAATERQKVRKITELENGQGS